MEELREAVEMLNDTVRERGRSQSHDQAIQELMSKVRRGDFRYIYIYISHALITYSLFRKCMYTSDAVAQIYCLM